jgi:hypothetical protein
LSAIGCLLSQEVQLEANKLATIILSTMVRSVQANNCIESAIESGRISVQIHVNNSLVEIALIFFSEVSNSFFKFTSLLTVCDMAKQSGMTHTWIDDNTQP